MVISVNRDTIVEYIFRDMRNGELWIDVKADGRAYGSLGPFATRDQRMLAYDDLVEHMRQLGAKDVKPQ